MKKIFYVAIFSSLLACSKKQTTTELKDSTNIVLKDSIEKPKPIDFSDQENDLLQLYSEIETAKENTNDLVEETSKKYSDSLISFIQNNPNSLYYSFEKLQNQRAIYVATSTDQKFRIYSWDTHLGGTMRFFDQLFQFQSQNKTNTKVRLASKDAQAFFSKIYTVQQGTKSIYLAVSNSILSSKYSTQQITAYEIQNNNLEEVKLFKSKNQLLSSISVEFDFFSVVDRPERPVELITLEGNKLKIPLINEDLKVLNKNLIYEWNGTLFNYKGVE